MSAVLASLTDWARPGALGLVYFLWDTACFFGRLFIRTVLFFVGAGSALVGIVSAAIHSVEPEAYATLAEGWYVPGLNAVIACALLAFVGFALLIKYSIYVEERPVKRRLPIRRKR